MGASVNFWRTAAWMAAAQQQLIMETRQQRLMLKEKSEPKRLAAADQAMKEGDIGVACQIYVRLSHARPPSEITQTAKQRITDLQQQARRELDEVDAMLPYGENASRSTPALKTVSPSDYSEDSVSKAFMAYDVLARKYASVPVVNDEIKKRVDKQQRRPEYVARLNAATAKSLWKLGQQYESDGHRCCAFLVYEQAAKLAPAQSAQLAASRYEELKNDPPTVASVETCRELQWCHEAYLRAEHAAEKGSSSARSLFEQITRRAPKDSQVYLAAKQRLEES